MRDFHQCMVAEIRYDDDPTEAGASPFTSDNLAQRNLAVLSSANPGDEWTRTVEQAFELDLARPARRPEDVLTALALVEAHEHAGEHETCENCGHDKVDSDELCARCGGAGEVRPLTSRDPVGFLSSFAFERLVDEEALSLAMRTPHEPLRTGTTTTSTSTSTKRTSTRATSTTTKRAIGSIGAATAR